MRGPKPLPKDVFKLVLSLYQSFVEIAQANGEGWQTENNNMLPLVNKVVAPIPLGNQDQDKLATKWYAAERLKPDSGLSA